MKIIVDEINPQDCPFYIEKSWGNSLHIEYEEGNCKLDTEPWEGELQRWSCHAKKGDKECPFRKQGGKIDVLSINIAIRNKRNRRR